VTRGAIAMLLFAGCAAEVDTLELPVEGCPASEPSTDARAVLLRTASGGRCSAAVVGPRSLLTAAHCVEHGDPRLELDDGAVTPTDVDGVDPDGADFAILRLPAYRFDVEPFDVATHEPGPGEYLALIGYGCTRQRERRLLGVAADPPPRAQAADDGRAFGCACHGDSGAPLIDGEGHVAGIFVGWTDTGEIRFVRASSRRP